MPERSCLQHTYDKQASLCELHHSLGWGATLQEAKILAEALLVSGVNCLVPHGFFYSTHALKKHDAPPSFFFQMPYYKLFSKLSERLDRIGSLLSGTYIDAQVFVVDPHSGIPDRADVSVYADMIQALAQNHIDFHIVDTDILEEGQISDGVVKVKEVCARGVVVPPMKVVEDPLREWLDIFRKSGGCVIECTQGADLNRVLQQIQEVVQQSLSVQCGGREVADVYLVRRVSKNRSLWFVLNYGDKAVDAEIRVGPGVATEGVRLREIPLDRGVPCGLSKSREGYRRLIHPFEFLVVEAVECDGPGAPTDSDLSCDCPIIEVPVSGRASIRLKNKNLLRMYEWEMSLLEEDRQISQTAIVPAVPISDQLEKGGFVCTHQPEVLRCSVQA